MGNDDWILLLLYYFDVIIYFNEGNNLRGILRRFLKIFLRRFEGEIF